MKSLEVVDSLPGIEELSKATWANEIPGFQIAPKAVLKIAARDGLDPIFDAIEGPNCEAPFTEAILNRDIRNYPPHVDGNLKGLAVNRNDRGDGIVSLATATELINHVRVQTFDETNGSPFEYTGAGITAACKFAGIEIGEVYVGVVTSGTWTVFSNGNLPNLAPTVHYFNRGENDPRAWWRYASTYYTPQLGASGVQTLAEQFRLYTNHFDYMDAVDDLNHAGKIILAKEERDSLRHLPAIPENELRAYISEHPGQLIFYEDKPVGHISPYPYLYKDTRVQANK